MRHPDERDNYLDTHRRNDLSPSVRNGPEEGWRRGWDSHHCWMLKAKNLTGFHFRVIRQIRTKAAVETRIEHADWGPIPKSSTEWPPVT
jgi:hypothetical protein